MINGVIYVLPFEVAFFELSQLSEPAGAEETSTILLFLCGSRRVVPGCLVG